MTRGDLAARSRPRPPARGPAPGRSGSSPSAPATSTFLPPSSRSGPSLPASRPPGRGPGGATIITTGPAFRPLGGAQHAARQPPTARSSAFKNAPPSPRLPLVPGVSRRHAEGAGSTSCWAIRPGSASSSRSRSSSPQEFRTSRPPPTRPPATGLDRRTRPSPRRPARPRALLTSSRPPSASPRRSSAFVRMLQHGGGPLPR